MSLRSWWRCASVGHQPTVFVSSLTSDKAIVRCACGRGVLPRLVPIEQDGVMIVTDDWNRRRVKRSTALLIRCGLAEGWLEDDEWTRDEVRKVFPGWQPMMVAATTKDAE